jgi:uncharacterized protein (DUF427 family)
VSASAPPRGSLKSGFLVESRTRSLCLWKVVAGYYDVVVDGEVNPDAAFVYRRPSLLARKIKNHVAFWRGVRPAFRVSQGP